MEDFLVKVKAHASKAKDEATKIGKHVYEKTNNVIGKTKVSFAISETESKIKDIYAEIGETVYARYCAGEEVCDFAKEICARIDELVKEKEDLVEKLEELKESVKCADCGKHNKADAAYCSKCGSKLNTTMKNGDIEFEAEPIAVYTEETADSDADTEEVVDDAEVGSVKKVVTIKAKKSVED